MKDMRQSMGEFEATNGSTQTKNTNEGYSQTTTSTSAKGDYIDFEEVK